jgi:hypothetical protein
MSATQSWLIAVGVMVARQVRVDRQVVPRVGGDHEGAPPHAQQIVLAHHPQHALVVDLEAAPLQFAVILR